MLIPTTATNLNEDGTLTVTLWVAPSVVMRDQTPKWVLDDWEEEAPKVTLTALGLVLGFARGWCPGCIGLGHAEWKTHRAACSFREMFDPW